MKANREKELQTKEELWMEFLAKGVLLEEDYEAKLDLLEKEYQAKSARLEKE